MDKFCEACGETFQKDPRYSKAQWAAARFCSTACSGASQKGVERPKQELSARFWDQVKKAGQDDCWEWGGARDNHGYGQIAIRQEDGRHRPIKAHRVAWFLTYGRWPTPYALHHCDNPPCVNVRHLFEGTTQDNTADMMQKGRHNPVPRKRLCKRGHPLSGANLKIKHLSTRNGVIARSCRACENLMQERRRGATGK
jgi:hypothetical protein